MVIKFSKTFKSLIRDDVPREFLLSREGSSNNYNEKYPVPEDGFVSCYCKEPIEEKKNK